MFAADMAYSLLRRNLFRFFKLPTPEGCGISGLAVWGGDIRAAGMASSPGRDVPSRVET